MNSPLVSVIMPSFNSAGTISRAIYSVINQTFQDWELIIADDFSTDQTRSVVQKLQRLDERVIFISREWNAGPAVTRNRAIAAARGRYIAFLDADDLWYPHKLEKQIAFMEQQGVSLSYSGYRRVNEQYEPLGELIPPISLSYKDLLKSCRIGCLTAIYDTKLLGGKIYMPNIAKRQDFALWLKILRQGDVACGLVDVLADYTVAKNSVSSNKFTAAKFQWRVYREVEKLSLVSSFYYFCCYFINGLARRV